MCQQGAVYLRIWMLMLPEGLSHFFLKECFFFIASFKVDLNFPQHLFCHQNKSLSLISNRMSNNCEPQARLMPGNTPTSVSPSCQVCLLMIAQAFIHFLRQQFCVLHTLKYIFGLVLFVFFNLIFNAAFVCIESVQHGDLLYIVKQLLLFNQSSEFVYYLLTQLPKFFWRGG